MAPASSSQVPSGLVLFLSVDLVGSTAFKAAGKATNPAKVGAGEATAEVSFQDWLPVFTGFYYQFPTRLRAAFEKEPSGAVDLGDPPIFWKPIGDELVFTKRISHEVQAFRTVRAFRTAVLEYRKELRQKHPSLDLKASAWLAGFPVGNTMVPLGDVEVLGQSGGKPDMEGEPLIVAFNLARAVQTNDAKARVDYLGPAIDAGFRLGRLASPRKFVVSIDLAYLLTEKNHGDGSLEFWYEGRVEMKGVLGNRPYPVFWIDMEPTELDEKEDLLIKRAAVPGTDVHKFAELFLDSTDGAICRPYLVGSDGKPTHGEIPPRHAKVLELIRQAADRDLKREADAAKKGAAGKKEVPATDLTELLPEKAAPSTGKRDRKTPAPKRAKVGAGKKR